MQKYAGQYVLVVEGSIPSATTASTAPSAGAAAVDLLKEAAAGAAAIIATGNCATFGGLPKAQPNPTGAKGVWEVITDKTGREHLRLPGHPRGLHRNAGPLPDLWCSAATGRSQPPMAYYGKTIHDRCLRRPFYEAGKFAESFDDEGARQGWCLYKLGCKGPTTYNACASLKWDEGLSFPVQSGHPCLGCSEPDFWDGGGFYQGQSAPLSRPTVAAVGAAAAAGAALGVALGGANRLQRRGAAKTTKEE